ncbi:MAG: CoA transferase [Desulfobacterales bacterium]
MKQALDDIRVLDLTWHIAGPYCTKLLADFGAEVIKIEKPGDGDPARRMGPFPNDVFDPEKSGMFLNLNTNKKSITLDLKSFRGRKIFLELVKKVDVLVESFSPKVMPGLGLDYETLEKVNPALVMVSISNFGQSGPYRDFRASDLIMEGMAHSLLICGLPDREPQKLAPYAMQYQTGNAAATAAMAGVFAGRRQGVGQHIDVNIMEVNLNSIDRRIIQLLAHSYTGEVAGREGEPAFGILPFRAVWTCDGYVEVGVTPTYWPAFAEMLGQPDLMERFPNIFDMERQGEFEATYLPWFLERTKQEAMETAQKQGVFVVKVNTARDVMEDSHFNERNFFVEGDHPAAGRLKYPGPPFRPEKTPWKLKTTAPLLGQHNEEIYGAIGYNRKDLLRLAAAGTI